MKKVVLMLTALAFLLTTPAALLARDANRDAFWGSLKTLLAEPTKMSKALDALSAVEKKPVFETVKAKKK